MVWLSNVKGSRVHVSCRFINCKPSQSAQNIAVYFFVITYPNLFLFPIMFAIMKVSNKHPNIAKTLLALTVVLYKVNIWPQRPRTKEKKRTKYTVH